jgi:hypothetical protein
MVSLVCLFAAAFFFALGGLILPTFLPLAALCWVWAAVFFGAAAFLYMRLGRKQL